MRRTILLILLSSGSLFSQEVKFYSIFPEIKRSERVDRVDVDTLRYYSMNRIDSNTYYTYLIKPTWTHQIGLLKHDHFESVFQSDSDGNMIRSYFYQSESDPFNIIIVSPHCFDDGCSKMMFFEYENQTLEYIGELVLFSIKNDPILGRVFQLPITEMAVSKKDANLFLRFSDGEYSQSENYKVEPMNGPIEVVLRNGIFNLKPN